MRFVMLAALLPVLLVSAPVLARPDADPQVTAKRVDTLEAQMRAVQRKVFTGGDPKFFTPEISQAPAAPAAAPEGTPSSAPITDLTARVDALERQLRTLTGQVEENQNTLRQLDAAMSKLRGDTEFRLNALEAGTRPGVAVPPAATPNAAPLPVPAATPAPAKAGVPAKPAPGKPAPAKPVAAAVVAPAGDPVEAAWHAAYARYTAKDYDGAATAFSDFIAANPKAARTPNAQYWLGRSYAAQNKPALAAKAYLDGYQKFPKADHAPDSLLGLGTSLIALKKPEQACQALGELKSVYGDKLTPAQTAQAARARTAAKCES